MGKKKIEPEIIEEIPENISIEPLENVMGDRFSIYAKDVIQDRAIPDVRDGMKPVQRRIIFSMYKSGNTFNKPTKKCAHTVGAVMGTYHPHGDTSIYEALARMSQDWKVRYPLISFQGNNGSIDGDSPAAYRYTESRLSELSNELVKEIEKNTVDMMLNFDDTEFEPTVLPARFPNLFANGTEGIAVALATEIPPHNLRELIDAIIYRIGHKTATTQDLLEFVKGPDFPGGGYIYRSQGIQSIYETGRGRIEMSAKAEIIDQKTIQQIIITELPYKAVKIQTVYEIDKIRHSKAIDGILEVRDESDWKGIRIVVDIKKEAKADLILAYLMNKTSLQCSYSANMVAIVDGRPKTLDLLTYVDSYIAHQVEVITRKSKYDLDKAKSRLHIVDGLIIASLNINDVVEIIRHSNDKADSKINLMKAYNFSNDQAEAIVTMPLYKLSHTDEQIFVNEKKELESQIEELESIIADPAKLNRVLIKDLRAIASKYGDDRRTQIIDKVENKPVDKRELIAKEEVMIAVTYDGYLKRSSIKSFKSSNDLLPGVKDGDALVCAAQCITTDYVICFTNKGNYVVVPCHLLTENRWKDEGTHINDFTNLGSGEKIIKVMVIDKLRNDLYLAILSRLGQIKRMPVNNIELAKRSRPIRCMKILASDSVVGVELLSGNSDLLVITNNGNASLYNENELTIVSSNAGGVKSINGLGTNQASALLAFEESEKTKVVLFTDKGHQRTIDISKLVLKTGRLGKVSNVLQSFKNDIHKIVGATKVGDNDLLNVNLALNNSETKLFALDDFRQNENMNAKTNIDLPPKSSIFKIFDINNLMRIDNKVTSHPIVIKQSQVDIAPVSQVDEIIINDVADEEKPSKEKDESSNFEQISIFDDIDM